MNSLYIPAYAKINLFLEIHEKRPDGFHNIESVMHTVSLCDDVTLEINGSGTITLDCPALDIPAEKNIAWKAAKLYAERTAIKDGIHITIKKNIPWEAGLGGGSSDAGAVLRALNTLYGKMSEKELLTLAAEIGSDVPFCTVGGCMHASGRGEILSALPCLPDCHILIIKGDAGTSTAAAYAAADAVGFTPELNRLSGTLETSDLNEICKHTFNRFEDTAPYVTSLKDALLSNGALTALLSGSGSAVFAIFDDLKSAEAAREKFIGKGYFAKICTPVKITTN